MKFSIHTAEQRSSEWFAARAGRITGSRACDIVAKIKSGEAAARRDYKLQIVVERMIGQAQEDAFITKEMQRGIDLEPAAFAAYEAQTGLIARRTGFLCADDLMAGCSIDGDVGNFKGIIELKCPKSTTHVRYMKAGVLPSDHAPQVTHNLWVTGAAWCDFVSFDDRLPIGLQFFRVRVMRDAIDIAGYEKEALAFLAEVEKEIEALASLRMAA